jgi:hypothetical protein
MKTVYELSNMELEELRESYFYQLEERGEFEVLNSITNPEEIDMSNIIDHYKGVFFVEEDFFCNL